jgi:hypothetical protein
MSTFVDDPCCVVDQFCERPANLEVEDGDEPLTTRCFHCKELVCENCSTRRQYRSSLGLGVPRICHDCSVELDGNDDVAMKHLRRQAGYGKQFKPLRLQDLPDFSRTVHSIDVRYAIER